MDLERVKAQAQKELDEEEFRAAVERCKEKLRSKTLWDRVFPWKLITARKEKV